MTKRIDLFNEQWETMKWKRIERARDLWLTYASTGKIQRSILGVDWVSPSDDTDNHSLKLAAAEATLTALAKMDETFLMPSLLSLIIKLTITKH